MTCKPSSFRPHLVAFPLCPPDALFGLSCFRVALTGGGGITGGGGEVTRRGGKRGRRRRRGPTHFRKLLSYKVLLAIIIAHQKALQAFWVTWFSKGLLHGNCQ